MTLRSAIVSGVIVGIVLFVFDYLLDFYVFSQLFSGVMWEPVNAWWVGKGVVYSIVTAVFFVCFYVVLYDGLPAPEGSTHNALFYGVLFWAMAVLPSSLLFELYTTVNYSVIIYWLVKGLFKYLLAGYVMHILYK